MKKKSLNFESSSYAELDELVTRVLCDTASPEHVADAAYLFGETKDNEDSVLAAALLAWKLKRVRRIALCSAGEVAGYPGLKNWKAKLIKLGIPAKSIVGIPLVSDFPPSTHAESWGLARCAKKNKWKNIYVIAPPLHQLRAFVTTVTAFKKEKTLTKIFNFVGLPQQWEEHIIHSQGVQRGTRSELLGKELKKIENYYKSGDLISGDEVLKYLDQRDK